MWYDGVDRTSYVLVRKETNVAMLRGDGGGNVFAYPIVIRFFATDLSLILFLISQSSIMVLTKKNGKTKSV